MTAQPGAAELPAHTTSVVIVDDHSLLVDSLIASFDGVSDISVTGVATTAADAVTVISQMRPNVCILDQRLPDRLGTDCLPLLRDASPRTYFLLMTGDLTDAVLRRAVEAGVAGVISKGERAAALQSAVRRASAGHLVFNAEQLARIPMVMNTSSRVGSDLSPRELDVLRLLAQGLTPKQIAGDLFIAPATVRNHVQAILVKLAVHSRLEAVTLALREGIVDPPQTT